MAPPDKTNPAGDAPSLPPLKLYRFVKPVPSVLTVNTVPLPEVPPKYVAPYRAPADRIKFDSGEAPSLSVKLCRVVKFCALSADVSRTAPAKVKAMNIAL